MPLILAQMNAWSLAHSLLKIVVVFRTEGRDFGVIEAEEYDGDPASIVHEYPHRSGRGWPTT